MGVSNMKVKRNILKVLFVLFTCCLFSLGATFAYANEESNATNPLDSITSFTMSDGAYIRVVDVNGIRFVALLSEKDYTDLEKLEQNGDKVTYGMLIAPRSYVDETPFTPATVFGNEAVYGYTIVNEDGTTGDRVGGAKEIINLTYDELTLVDGYYEVRGSIIKIKDKNLTNEFVGLGYVAYTPNGGETVYRMATYTNNEISNNSRSVAYLAQVAYEKTNDNNLKTKLNDLYLTKVSAEETTYTVKTFVGNNLVNTVTKNALVGQTVTENPSEVQGYTLDSESSSLSGTVYANGKLTLSVVYQENSEIENYRLANGGFENGLDGWTLVGNIGNVSEDSNYWLNDPENAEGFAFGKDGEKMFSAYAVGAEEKAVGTLTSSTFTVGGSGFVTFKLGAAKDGNYVYVDVVDANTKEILARYNNGLWAERTNDVKSGCTLVAYKADLSAYMGKEVFFRISDNADSGYGLFFVDSFNTCYVAEPDGFNNATPVNYAVSGTIYDLFNGGFEMGDVQGWWNIGNAGHVTGADAFFSGVAYGKEGNFLYSGVEDHGAGNGLEGNKGTLTSSVFEIGGSGYITYMLGGGNEICFVQVIDSTTNEVLAKYRQQAREDAVLKNYVADLTAYVGRTVRIQVVDDASSDWGCVSFDNVKTYHTSKPEGYIDAIDVKYEIVNGSFESGIIGWSMNITEAGAHNTLGWVESSEHDAGWYTKNDDRKDGNNLFTFCKPDGTNCENTKGTLNSYVFTLKQNSYVSFRFGGAGTRDVYMQLVRADGNVIATFYNEAEGKVNTEMYAYYYQYVGETADCFFRVVDNSTSNYGCFVVDDFRVNLQSAPDGFIPAIQ